MTDNFNIIREYIKANLQSDEYTFEIQLIRRGKDHPNLPAANYCFKSYYIDCLETFDKYEDEIRKCCDMFGLRAYVSVNAKSKVKTQLEHLRIITEHVCSGTHKKPWRTFQSAYGKTKSDDKRWVIDIDNQDSITLDEYIKLTEDVIRTCFSAYNDPTITKIPTKTGMHLITHPFNQMEFAKKMLTIINEKYGDNIDVPDIKENAITLLYENL